MNSISCHRIGFISLALAVIFGAFGAHILKSTLMPNALQAWQTAVLYQFIHSLGLLIVATHIEKSKYMLWTARLLVIGLLCFSGSLYLLACKDLLPVAVDWVGPVTPLGGAAWVGAWICAAIGASR